MHELINEIREICNKKDCGLCPFFYESDCYFTEKPAFWNIEYLKDKISKEKE